MAKEASRSKFVELAEPRVSQVLDKLTLLGKLARPRDYAYTDADVDAMQAAVVAKVTETFDGFRNPKAAHKEPTWQLPTDAPAATPERAAATKKSA